MRLVLLGPPGSGKGTQAARICETFGLAHLASGDILRAQKSAGTPLGLKVRDFMDAGLLVPDDLMLQVMREKIKALDQGFVLDGFPRTLPQAKALDGILAEISRPLDLVLNFVVQPEVLAQRFSGRRICPACLSVYHVDSNAPKQAGICDLDGQKLIIREDDRPAVVAQRIATYQETMAPLLAFYAQPGGFETIDATGSIAEVTKAVLDKVRRHFAE